MRPLTIPRTRPAALLLPSGLALAAALLVPRSAEACGASPPSTYSVTGLWPTSGSTGVPRDSGIIASGTSSSEYSDAVLGADIELFDADSGAAVPLVQGSWSSAYGDGPELTIGVHPVEPLEPLHAYRVEATTVDPDTGERSEP
ncbi:MAG TPA: hypothetical protein VMG12_33665, partial [Polyangiaceae bacterium]|nr:hypothetical protein [Polyangiaceae bacterium]